MKIISRGWARRILNPRWRHSGSRKLLSEIERRAGAGEPVRIHVGANRFEIEGWLNTDIRPTARYYLDASALLPMPDASVDRIFGEHFIEHLDLETGRQFVREARRVLRPGGVLRLATPDLEGFVAVYREAGDLQKSLLTHLANRGGRDFGSTAASLLNQQFYGWRHRYLYDYETIQALLVETGFGRVIRCELRSSEHADLSDLERHESGSPMDSVMLVVEATKTPAAC